MHHIWQCFTEHSWGSPTTVPTNSSPELLQGKMKRLLCMQMCIADDSAEADYKKSLPTLHV